MRGCVDLGSANEIQDTTVGSHQLKENIIYLDKIFFKYSLLNITIPPFF